MWPLLHLFRMFCDQWLNFEILHIICHQFLTQPIETFSTSPNIFMYVMLGNTFWYWMKKAAGMSKRNQFKSAGGPWACSFLSRSRVNLRKSLPNAECIWHQGCIAQRRSSPAQSDKTLWQVSVLNLPLGQLNLEIGTGFHPRAKTGGRFVLFWKNHTSRLVFESKQRPFLIRIRQRYAKVWCCYSRHKTDTSGKSAHKWQQSEARLRHQTPEPISCIFFQILQLRNLLQKETWMCWEPLHRHARTST